MSDADGRIAALEKQVKDLKLQLDGSSRKKEKATRKPSAYNLHMATFMTKEKEKLKDKYDHKKAFKSAVESWKNKSQ
tara:strand:+ start:34 stop:264 length:231 start_codon:yes stop_codon:yes gene_type:complete